MFENRLISKHCIGIRKFVVVVLQDYRPTDGGVSDCVEFLYGFVATDRTNFPVSSTDLVLYSCSRILYARFVLSSITSSLLI